MADCEKKLAEVASPETLELTQGPTADHCLPSEFDLGLCRQYLGIDPISVKGPTVVPTPDVETQLHARMLELYTDQQAASDLQSVAPGVHRSARNGLELCAAMRQRTDRGDGCATAQRRLLKCGAFVSDWRQRKAALLADIDRLHPGLGQAYSDPAPVLRGVAAQPTNEQRWNDAVPCPVLTIS